MNENTTYENDIFPSFNCPLEVHNHATSLLRQITSRSKSGEKSTHMNTCFVSFARMSMTLPIHLVLPDWEVLPSESPQMYTLSISSASGQVWENLQIANKEVVIYISPYPSA
jgi:hypothetical protein